LLAIFEAVCQAVGYAHAHRVIHRDLKPANIMVGTFGEVQVMDWGLAKILGEETPATAEAAEQTRVWTQASTTPETGSHTQAGSLVGTPAYAPPEQALGEIAKINERADVFGLGALLAVILTGKPPYVGESFESVRVQAARGKLEDCFARLDACGAEPGLIELCKKCLAFEPAARPPDAGAVAQAVAGLRAAAEERARTAEREQAAAAARAAERRQRRRLWLGAAAVLAVAVVGGLSAVLAVQRHANAELADKNTELAQEQAKVEARNRELAEEQAKVEARNRELAEEQAKVQARFELAQKAISLFHTGVSEDMLLKQAEFKELRTKLLQEAAGFYADLEKLLAGQADAKSRQALATAYYQLGQLTDKIGDKKQALAVHRKALALRRELAAAEGADVETRLDLARSLGQVGELLGATGANAAPPNSLQTGAPALSQLLSTTGDNAGALAAYEEQRDLAERLAAEHATDPVRVVLAQCYHRIGYVLLKTGKHEQALVWYRKALAIRQKLADANPAVTDFQRSLSATHTAIGSLLSETEKTEEALTEYGKALAIQEKLADANPAVTDFQLILAYSEYNMGLVLRDTGKPEDAQTALRRALSILQRLADANPAVTELQYMLAKTHTNIGILLAAAGTPEEAMNSFLKALALFQKVADANPAVTEFQVHLTWFTSRSRLSKFGSGRKRNTLPLAREAWRWRRIQKTPPSPSGWPRCAACGRRMTKRTRPRSVLPAVPWSWARAILTWPTTRWLSAWPNIAAAVSLKPTPRSQPRWKPAATIPTSPERRPSTAP
jgi:tetratricopeptide (TPR) repeat protein